MKQFIVNSLRVLCIEKCENCPACSFIIDNAVCFIERFNSSPVYELEDIESIPDWCPLDEPTDKVILCSECVHNVSWQKCSHPDNEFYWHDHYQEFLYTKQPCDLNKNNDCGWFECGVHSSKIKEEDIDKWAKDMEKRLEELEISKARKYWKDFMKRIR